FSGISVAKYLCTFGKRCDMKACRALLILTLLALAVQAQEPTESPPGKNPPRKLPESVLNASDLPLIVTPEDKFIQTIRWNAVADPVQRAARQNPEPLPPAVADGPKEPADPTTPVPDTASTPVTAPPAVNLLTFPLDDSSFIQIEGVMRGYYRDDQRIL